MVQTCLKGVVNANVLVVAILFQTSNIASEIVVW